VVPARTFADAGLYAVAIKLACTKTLATYRCVVCSRHGWIVTDGMVQSALLPCILEGIQKAIWSHS